MGNHFRKPGDGQAAPKVEDPRLSVVSADDIVAPEDTGFEPVTDPFVYTPAPDVTAPVAPLDMVDTTDDATVPSLDADMDPQVTQPGLLNIPSPTDPVAPSSTGAFMTSAGAVDPTSTDVSEQKQVASLDAALQNPDFTSVFAPQVDSRKKMARDAGVEPVILMEHLTKIYAAQPNKPALDDVNIEIYPGEFVFLVGHSGSGKTTLLSTLMRDVKPTSGRVLVAGQDLMRIKNRKVPFLRRQIGAVFQDFKLLPNKTAYENVAFALECIGKPRGVIRSQVPEVLRLVGLADQMDSMPDQLSGGEQQRVAVARAMVNRPPLLICDEPTGNLDPAISLGIMKLLERINRTGTTVIVATHDRAMVDSMRRRVIALEAGHVIRDQERGGYGNYGA